MSTPSIPGGLTAEEEDVYQICIKVTRDRKAKGVLIEHATIITDLARDFDDLVAMVVVKELARLGLVYLSGFIANLEPPRRRAIYGRGALDSLDMQAVPIGVGTEGTTDYREAYDYEFEASFMPEEETFIPKEGSFFEDGSELLHQVFTQALLEGRKENLLLISSTTDIEKYAKAYPDIFRSTAGKVYMQGGYSISAEGILTPHRVTNNTFDFRAAEEFHKRLAEDHIPSNAYTRVAAYATEISATVFHDLEATQHPIGTHLRHRHLKQDVAFYKVACSSKPFNDMTQERFLHTKTTFYKKHPPGPLFSENGTPLPLDGTPLPKGDEIKPYLTVVIVYDALPALNAGGDDLLAALDVLDTESMANQTSIHKLIGTPKLREGLPDIPNINSQRMAFVISTLMKGSLYDSMQNAARSELSKG